MTRDEFRDYLGEMQQLRPVAKRERVTQIRAGVETSYGARKGSGFVSLTEVINDGVAVSQEIQRRAALPLDAETPRNERVER